MAKNKKHLEIAVKRDGSGGVRCTRTTAAGNVLTLEADGGVLWPKAGGFATVKSLTDAEIKLAAARWLCA